MEVEDAMLEVTMAKFTPVFDRVTKNAGERMRSLEMDEIPIRRGVVFMSDGRFYQKSRKKKADDRSKDRSLDRYDKENDEFGYRALDIYAMAEIYMESNDRRDIRHKQALHDFLLELRDTFVDRVGDI